MKATKKALAAAAAAVMAASILAGCNRTVIDTTYAYDYAYVALPDGTCVEGAVQNWKDYDGDQLQVTIDGRTYLSNSSRIVLMAKG